MDWSTLAELGTAVGTLILAIATFAATRSATRSARVAERQLAAGIRPLLVSSREQDPPQKIGFADRHYARPEGGRGTAEVADGVIYLTMSLRNVGSGVAVLDSWGIVPGAAQGVPGERPDPGSFTRLTRDIYVAPNDIGFWQGAMRDPADPVFAAVRRAVETRDGLTVYLLYRDVEGGQRVISRFSLLPAGDDAWLATVARHWNLDTADPR
jgi:hypothetical protein